MCVFPLNLRSDGPITTVYEICCRLEKKTKKSDIYALSKMAEADVEFSVEVYRVF